MTIKPLTGQCLIELEPEETITHSGIALPTAIQKDAGGKFLPRIGKVIAVGPWKRTKQGFSVLPDFKPGERVLVGEYFGTKLTRNVSENYRLCMVDHVLAIVEGEGNLVGV
jgi:chaperonin GroES